MGSPEINYKLYNLYTVLTNTASYPYSVGNPDIRGISISNNSASNTLTIALTFKDARDPVSIPVPPGKNFESRTRSINTINMSGSVTDFQIALFERG